MWAGIGVEFTLTPLIVNLTRGEEVPDWRQDIVCEFHGHHFPLQQRMLRTRDFKLVVSPESINELYDLRTDPDELLNLHSLPEMGEVRRELTTRLYQLLRDRGDNFYHWMTTMFDVGEVDYDPTQSGLDESTYAVRGAGR